MAEKTIPWWRRAIDFALNGLRSVFSLGSRPARESDPPPPAQLSPVAEPDPEPAHPSAGEPADTATEADPPSVQTEEPREPEPEPTIAAMEESVAEAPAESVSEPDAQIVDPPPAQPETATVPETSLSVEMASQDPAADVPPEPVTDTLAAETPVEILPIEPTSTEEPREDPSSQATEEATRAGLPHLLSPPEPPSGAKEEPEDASGGSDDRPDSSEPEPDPEMEPAELATPVADLDEAAIPVVEPEIPTSPAPETHPEFGSSEAKEEEPETEPAPPPEAPPEEPPVQTVEPPADLPALAEENQTPASPSEPDWRPEPPSPAILEEAPKPEEHETLTQQPPQDESEFETATPQAEAQAAPIAAAEAATSSSPEDAVSPAPPDAQTEPLIEDNEPGGAEIQASASASDSEVPPVDQPIAEADSVTPVVEEADAEPLPEPADEPEAPVQTATPTVESPAPQFPADNPDTGLAHPAPTAEEESGPLLEPILQAEGSEPEPSEAPGESPLPEVQVPPSASSEAAPELAPPETLSQTPSIEDQKPQAPVPIDLKASARLEAMKKRIAEADPDSPFSILVGQVYEGPLDLLLDLIRKQDIDIYDIPIARITAQFLIYVDRLKESDVDVAGEFIYTASLLIHIKSKMLLPRAAAETGEQSEDPRRELVERLLEHERFKNAAQMLQEKQMLEAASWTNPGVREFKGDESAEPEIAADTVDLVRVFRDILERARSRPVIDVNEDSVTVGQMIQFLARRLTMEDKPVALRRMLSHTRSERALIAMFLALLELVRLQAILLRQDRAFSEIFIKKNSEFDALISDGSLMTQDDWR